MDRIFSSVGRMIEKYPFRVLLVTVLAFVILIAGISNIRMATGNETLVQIDNDVYISNKTMENSFGGDSILVIFNGTSSALLSTDNIEKMWNVEQRLKYEENIFSFMSPANLVHQMTEMQSTEIKGQLLALSDGLAEMGSRLVDIGNRFGSVEMINPADIQDNLSGIANLSAVFNELVAGQNNMTEGVGELQGGLLIAADGLGEASRQLSEISNLTGDNHELRAMLLAMAENINISSQGIRNIGEKTGNIQEGTSNTAQALTNISQQITAMTSSMSGGLTQGIAPDELQEMSAGFVTMGERLGDVAQGLRTFHNKSGMMAAAIPTDQAELDFMLFDGDKIRPIFSDVIVDDNNALMVIKLQGNLGDEYKDQIVEDVFTALEKEEFETISYVVSGKPVLDSSLRAEMKSNMARMVSLAVVIMLTVLAIVFKVRWRMLSLGVILVSVIATVGLMGILSVPVTMVSMAVFPILIGLGIDYSIQFHNRYEEERSVGRTIRKTGKAVAIAVLATALGFVSLFASPVPMIQDFGKMLTIGVIISFVGSLLLLITILHLRDKNIQPVSSTNKKQAVRENLLDKMLKIITRGVLRFSVPILIVAIVLAALGVLADGKVGVETDIETFMPQSMAALKDIHTVRDIVGSTEQLAIFMQADDILSEENVRWIQEKTRELQEKYSDIVVGVKSVDTLVTNLSQSQTAHNEYVNLVNTLPDQQLGMFLSEDRSESVILLNIRHLATEELQDFVTGLSDDLMDTGMEVHVTGKSVLDVEMVNGLTSGRVKMTLIGLALVFTALLIIYKNPFKALITIFPVAIIVGISSGIMYLLGINFTPITATLGALVLGMGTEMTVMLLERYIEERSSGRDKTESMMITVTMIGKAILASGLTTIGGFSVLMASEFVILKDFGLMTVINISLALLSTLIVLPPVLYLFDRYLLSKKEREEAESAAKIGYQLG